eukprot:10878914-Ditylum_brightwellii.AAC.1
MEMMDGSIGKSPDYIDGVSGHCVDSGTSCGGSSISSDASGGGNVNDSFPRMSSLPKRVHLRK